MWVTLCGSQCVGHNVSFVLCAICIIMCVSSVSIVHSLSIMTKCQRSNSSDVLIGSSTVMLMAVPLAKILIDSRINMDFLTHE